MRTKNVETLHKLSAGDFVEGGVDIIVQNLRQGNPDKDIDYENIYTNSNGYLAEITVNGLPVAHVEANHDAMVKNVERQAVDRIEKGEV